MSIDTATAKTRRITIRLFAAARDRAGEDNVEITIPVEATIHDARTSLARDIPPLAALAPYLLFAMNTEYAGDEEVIPPNCELAAFPPVSGG